MLLRHLKIGFMQRKFVAVDGQSLVDVCLNTYGTLDYLLKLIQDSGVVNLNADVSSQQVFLFDDSLVVDQSTIGQNQAAGIYYATKTKVTYNIGTGGDYNDDFSGDFNI
jgi:hypothetical protein